MRIMWLIALFLVMPYHGTMDATTLEALFEKANRVSEEMQDLENFLILHYFTTDNYDTMNTQLTDLYSITSDAFDELLAQIKKESEKRNIFFELDNNSVG